MPAEAFDVSNKFLVGASHTQVIIGSDVANVLTPNDAILLAAWLVAIAEPQADVPFDEILVAVQRSAG